MADVIDFPGPLAPLGDWTRQSACVGHPELFFAPFGERDAVRDGREAKAKSLCRRCPVVAECRDYALGAREQHGIWGGLNEVERAALTESPRYLMGTCAACGLLFPRPRHGAWSGRRYCSKACKQAARAEAVAR